MAFNWVGSGLTRVLASLFQLGVTSFYDDLSVTEEDAILTETEDLVNEFFELFGWDMKELPSFSEQPEPCEVRPPQGCDWRDPGGKPPEQS